jgi:hypothetical protein
MTALFLTCLAVFAMGMPLALFAALSAEDREAKRADALVEAQLTRK